MGVSQTKNLAACFDFKATVTSEKTLATLWAGYGTIKQLSVRNEEDGSTRSYVVKLVNPPQGSGVSHERKVHSYEVEAYFYSHVATPELIARCPMPRPVHVGPVDDLGRGGGLTLVMSDLRDEFPGVAGRYGSMDVRYAKAGLTWLANLHAAHWGNVPEGVAEQGTYWYLDTRMEEYEAIPRDWRALKDLAFEIDALCRGSSPGSGAAAAAAGSSGARPDERFLTLVHGDFKSANLMWREGPGGQPQCAACDYQYTGKALGMKDVAYFFTSAVSQKTLELHEEELLTHYHTTLTQQLTQQQAAEYTFEVAVDHFELCLLDFVRFMAGWGWWGADDWATTKARKYMAKRFGR